MLQALRARQDRSDLSEVCQVLSGLGHDDDEDEAEESTLRGGELERCVIPTMVCQEEEKNCVSRFNDVCVSVHCTMLRLFSEIVHD